MSNYQAKKNNRKKKRIRILIENEYQDSETEIFGSITEQNGSHSKQNFLAKKKIEVYALTQVPTGKNDGRGGGKHHG